MKEVLDSKFARGGLYYLIDWQGYPPSERCWVPAFDVFMNHFAPLFMRKRLVFKEAMSLENGSLSAYANHREQRGGSDTTLVAKKPPAIAPVDGSWEQVWPIGPGMENMGNTCFLNSVLQCLMHTPALIRFLQSGQHRCSNSDAFCAVCSMARLVKECFPRRAPVIRPLSFVTNLRLIANDMRVGRQEDAHEFLRYLLDAMHTKLATGTGVTPITDVFGGSLVSAITCLSCGHVSESVETFMDLSLDVHRVDSLERALHKFTAPELLQKSNRYRCPACDSLVDAHKTMSIHTSPATLAIQLKRFKHDGTKISRHVAFNESLDLSPYHKASSSESGKEHQYQLYAVLVHEGSSCISGHYHCFVKASNDAWYSMNDASVHSVGLPSVLQERAYILFYRKCTRNDGLLITPPDTRSATPIDTKKGGEHVSTGFEDRQKHSESKGKRELLFLPQSTSLWYIGLYYWEENDE